MVNVCKACEYKVDIKKFIAGFVMEKTCDVCGSFTKTADVEYQPNVDQIITSTVGGCAVVETY